MYNPQVIGLAGTSASDFLQKQAKMQAQAAQGLNQTTAPAERIGEIPVVLDILANAITDLQNAHDGLFIRLQTAIRQEPNKALEPEKPRFPPTSTVLGANITDQIARLEQMIQAVRTVTSLLET